MFLNMQKFLHSESVLNALDIKIKHKSLKHSPRTK